VSLEEGEGIGKIWHTNGKRSAAITVKLANISYEDAALKIDKVLKEKIKFSEGYSYEYDENLKKMKNNKREMLFAIGIAVLLVYMILASLFESTVVPFLIMTSMPLALIGVVIALFLSFSTFNISVYIGMIILAGIIVNNAIILVNSINQEFSDGLLDGDNLMKRIKEICYVRFRPILITTVTTVLGMIPMLLSSGEGSNLWRPLSLTVISGLVFSSMLTLVVVPLYSYTMYSWRISSQGKVLSSGAFSYLCGKINRSGGKSK
jgi:HAE1 family hydrophobic/amphiphilic exporter-1